MTFRLKAVRTSFIIVVSIAGDLTDEESFISSSSSLNSSTRLQFITTTFTPASISEVVSFNHFILFILSIFYVDILMELFVLKDLLFCCHLWMFRLFISRCTTSISLFHVSIDSRLVMCRMWGGIMVMSNPSTIRKDLVLSTQSMSYRMISFNIMEVGRMV